MGVTTSLRRARTRAKLSQRELGRLVGYSEQMISAVEVGGRVMAPDVALAAARHLDDGELYMALAEEAAGGVMVPIVLDGPKVDLHRLATGRKLVEEASEAIEAWAKAKSLVNCRSAEDLGQEGRAEALAFCEEVAELVTCAGNTLRVMCETYALSPREIYREHVAELVRKGYALRRTEARRNARTA